MHEIESHETFVGMLVTWLHVPRGGYGYAVPVDAKVVALNLQGNRAVIEVQTKDGRTVRRRVDLDRLRFRPDYLRVEDLRDLVCPPPPRAPAVPAAPSGHDPPPPLR